jgi:hypothetical protein
MKFEIKEGSKPMLIDLIYKSNNGVCLSVWAVPGRFFQSLPVPCGANL